MLLMAGHWVTKVYVIEAVVRSVLIGLKGFIIGREDAYHACKSLVMLCNSHEGTYGQY